MVNRKYKTEEIIQHLRIMEVGQAKGSTMEQITRKIGVSPPTLARWKKGQCCKDVDIV